MKILADHHANTQTLEHEINTDPNLQSTFSAFFSQIPLIVFCQRIKKYVNCILCFIKTLPRVEKKKIAY